MADAPIPAANTQGQPPAAPTPAQAKKAAKEIEVGSEVNLVTARGAKLVAKVTRIVKKTGVVDLTFDRPDGTGKTPQVITECLLDPTGKAPDSWHPIDE